MDTIAQQLRLGPAWWSEAGAALRTASKHWVDHGNYSTRDLLDHWGDDDGFDDEENQLESVGFQELRRAVRLSSFARFRMGHLVQRDESGRYTRYVIVTDDGFGTVVACARTTEV